MSDSIIIQGLKVRTYPLNSYYSYRNLDFIKPFLDDKENEENRKSRKDTLQEIFEEVRTGFMTAKLDTIKQQANIHWKERENKCSSINKIEKFYFDSCIDIANNFFYLKNGQIYVDGENKSKCNNTLSVGKAYNHKFEWNILKHLIDQDVLIGAYLISNGFDNVGDVQLLDTPILSTETLLEKVLNKGVAELHMHVGAAKNFSSIWVKLMNNNGNKSKEKILNRIKVPTYDGVKCLAADIQQAQIARFLLSVYLELGNEYKKGEIEFCKFMSSNETIEDNECGYKKEKLQEFIKKNLESYRQIINSFSQGKIVEDMNFKLLIDNLRVAFDCRYEKLNKLSDDFGNEGLLSNADEQILKEILRLEASSSISSDGANEIKNIILNRLGKSNYSRKQYFNNVKLGEDILTYIFKDYYTYNSETHNIEYNGELNFETIIMPESILIFKSMNYLKNCNHEDTLFAKVFWQYIKLKNIVYRYIVQLHTSGKGLDIFQPIFNNQKNIELNNIMAEVFYSQVKSQNIKKLEFRTGFKQDEHKLKKYLIEIFRVYKEMLLSNYFINREYKAITLIGVVFHFIKEEKKINTRCLLSNDYDISNSLEEKYLQEAKVVSKLRREIPELDNYIVGVDAASKELDTSPYVFKKAYQELRSNNSMKSIATNKAPYVKEIGFTYHVGEDFRDIISGLRHVDEAIEELHFKAGDRIGHGIVIGININKWAELNPSIYLKADEYLDNLLWEWNLYTKDREFNNIENIAFVEKKIYEVIDYIFGFSDGLRIIDLYACYEKKRKGKCFYHDKEDDCELKGYTEKKYKILNNEEDYRSEVMECKWTTKTIYNALSCQYFLKEMKKNVIINIDLDTINKYKKLQTYMKKKISDKQIIMEINPTSNLLIGDFRTFEDYHVNNLSSPKKEEVIITINTDDPVVFNTKISNEYALIYDIMMKTGEYESKEIIEWLNKIRKNSLEYSFIDDRKLTREELIEEVDRIIKALKE